MKNQTSNLIAAYAFARRTRNTMTTLLAGTFVMAQVTPSFASIDNTATATGTYNASTANYGTSSASVPVAAAAPNMTIAKTASAPTATQGSPLHTDATDTITYTYVVTNTGNVTLTNVVPVDLGTTFNGSPATGTLGAFSPASATLAPGANQSFTAIYPLTTLDVYHGAGLAGSKLVSDSAVAQGNYGPGGTSTFTIPNGSKSTALTTIVGFPSLSIAKTRVLADIVAPGNTALFADVGETITYTFKITNNGTVPMINVSPKDTHDNGTGGTPVVVALGGGSGITAEQVLAADVGPLGAAASTNITLNDGIINTLAPGATATFTWSHVVTLAEFNHG